MSKARQLADLGNVYDDGALSNRNRIINGAMVISQRNGGTAVTPTATAYTLDRYRLYVNTASKLTIQQVTDAPAGFTHSAKITVAASYTPAANEQFFYGTAFEAANVGDLGFGTASAQTTTLSFWVKSSVTGTYSFSWTNDANDRSYVGTFSILAANTWEKKTATIAGDTTGTWTNTGNSRHSFLQIGLGAGSDFDGTAGVWQAGNLRQTSGSVDFVAQSNGATFYLTGIQLEIGDTSTPFEHRSYGDELLRCQRYFQKYNYSNNLSDGATANTLPVNCCYTTTVAYGGSKLTQEMRTSPTFSGSAAGTWVFYTASSSYTSADMTAYETGPFMWGMKYQTSGSWTAGNAVYGRPTGTSSYYQFDAEL
jgi:hypothetical protein